MNRIYYHDRWRSRPSKAGVISSVLSRHVTIVLLPIMIATGAVALEARPILGLLVWAWPIGLAVAVLWTRAWYNSTIAAVLVRPDSAAVQTFAELTGSGKPSWQRVTDVRRTTDALEITIGISPYRLTRSEWEVLDDVAAHLESASESWTSRSGRQSET